MNDKTPTVLDALRDFGLIPVFLILFVITMLYAGVLWILEKFGVEI